MKVSIQKLDVEDEMFELDVEAHHTVKWMKVLISKHTGDPFTLIHLFHDGKELDDHMGLLQYFYVDTCVFMYVDPDPKCALISRVDKLNHLLEEISKSRLFKKI